MITVHTITGKIQRKYPSKKNTREKKISQKINDISDIKPVKNCIKIIQINVERLTRAKIDILSKIYAEANILTIQETHGSDEELHHLKIHRFHLM